MYTCANYSFQGCMYRLIPFTCARRAAYSVPLNSLFQFCIPLNISVVPLEGDMTVKKTDVWIGFRVHLFRDDPIDVVDIEIADRGA